MGVFAKCQTFFIAAITADVCSSKNPSPPSASFLCKYPRIWSSVLTPLTKDTASEFNLEDQIDLTMGTFSKTFASLGGFVAGEERVINYIKHYAPALIFSASPTPASVAAALAALDILEEHPELVNKLIRNAAKVRNAFKEAGFKVTEGRTAIVPVIVGDDGLAFKMWRMLYDAGVFVNVFISPGVPAGRQMMRTSYMAAHEDSHLDSIVDIFKDVGKKLGVI